MKKNIAWILMVIAILSLIGCGENKNEITKTDVDLQEEEITYNGEIMESYPSELGGVNGIIKPADFGS